MDRKEQKAKDNERLIGKTIYWTAQQEDFVGKAVRVKSHESIVVLTPDNVEHEVDLFDITSTTNS